MNNLSRDARVLRALRAAPVHLLPGDLAANLSMPLADFAEILVGRYDIKVAPVDTRIAIETAALPSGLHGDPGDRILVATARHLACPLATTDDKILAYATQGHVQVIDASR